MKHRFWDVHRIRFLTLECVSYEWFADVDQSEHTVS